MSAQDVNIGIDLDSMTLGDLIDIEAATGKKLTDIDMESPSMLEAAAIAWIVARKEEPGLTFGQVRAWPMSRLEGLAPKAEAGEPARPAASRRKSAG